MIREMYSQTQPAYSTQLGTRIQTHFFFFRFPVHNASCKDMFLIVIRILLLIFWVRLLRFKFKGGCCLCYTKALSKQGSAYILCTTVF